MKAIVLALVLLASTGSLLTARLIWPAGGSGSTMLPQHAPTATPTPAAAQEAVRRLASMPLTDAECGCASALKDALITARDRVPDDLKAELKPLIGKYL